MLDIPHTWTPKLVAEQLLEAQRWALRTAGRTSPAGMSTVMPVYAYSRDDLAAQDELPKDAAVARRPVGSLTVSLFEAALYWQATYLALHPGPRRVLKGWVRCKTTHGGSFTKYCKARGWSRATADRAKHRALSLIAQGLERDGIPPP